MRWIQILIFFAVLLGLVKPMGSYIERVFSQRLGVMAKWLCPLEYGIYRICRIDPRQEMTWQNYALALLCFNVFGLVFLYLLQRWQYFLPLNPQNLASPSPDSVFNTAVSFTTNTNWQSYLPEASLSSLTQMLGLTVQNFFSAASGLCVLLALLRGLVRSESKTLGNFWSDLLRSLLYILLPLSILLSLALVSQGVIQNFKEPETIRFLEKQPLPTQVAGFEAPQLPMGPVASQVAIKQLGSNGGGFFNANSAHPFENPTGLSNFLEMLAIMLLPASLCYTFGLWVGDRRQGWAIFAAMCLLLAPPLLLGLYAEQQAHPALVGLGVADQAQGFIFPGGNLEGKESRFGILGSVLWTVLTTATSNGSVNSALDSYTPLGGLVPMWLMQLGEIAFGGLGSGLQGMLMMVIISVFVAGLLVGRSPEYLGKKIEPFEMKMAAFAILVMPFTVLLSMAWMVLSKACAASIANPGPHGFSELLYAFSSMGNGNGSAFAGLSTNTPSFNLLGGLVMLIGRYWLLIPSLALAGSLAAKKTLPSSAGTLQTYRPLFVLFLVAISMILGGLAFLPALALGPLAEHSMIWGG